MPNGVAKGSSKLPAQLTIHVSRFICFQPTNYRNYTAIFSQRTGSQFAFALLCHVRLAQFAAVQISSFRFYPRDAMLARVIVIATCLSVCLSLTRRYCVKTISSPSGSPKTLVFWRQISSPNSKGFPRTGASNKGRSEKFCDFLDLSVNISKTVADTAKVTIND